jgi:hypothetical protein
MSDKEIPIRPCFFLKLGDVKTVILIPHNMWPMNFRSVIEKTLGEPFFPDIGWMTNKGRYVSSADAERLLPEGELLSSYTGNWQRPGEEDLNDEH